MVGGKIVFLKDPAFTLYYEDQGGRRFIHCDATAFSKGILKRMAHALCDLKEVSWDDGYHSLHCYTQNCKFVRMMGGAYLKSIECNNKVYEVYKWVT